jgi:pimeloyl-ACP methyl ester carboxylesterase
MTGDLSGTLLAVGRRYDGYLRALLLIPCQVRGDLLRTLDDEGHRRTFDLISAAYATAANPLLLWRNDDRDEGLVNEDSRRDLPGAATDQADFAQPAPRGMSDLVDWFPISIHLGRVAESLPAFDLRLSGPGASLVNVLETDLPLVEANQIYQNDYTQVYGASRGRFDGALKAERYPWGLNLSTGFADRMVGPRILGRGEGVVLLEGRASGAGPLRLTLVHRGTPKNREPHPEEILFKLELSLAVAPVEDFYRAIDAREANLRVPPRPRAELLKPRELPWVIFIHGFNVDADAGRAWGAEIFRRLYQSGSASPFVSFRWYGDQGAANYAMAVECAPAAADRLVALVMSLAREQPGRPVVLVGHSLGAYVALLTAERLGITRGSPIVRACVLVNGAVPAEALDAQAPWKVADYALGGEQVMATLMRAPETDWATQTQLADPALWSARWASYFPSGDLRRGCTWTQRFTPRARVINLYARTEDVLSPPAASSEFQPRLFDVATHGAWVFQEWRKGRLASTLASPTRAQAGWGYARDIQRRLRRHATATGEAQLQLRRSEPLFAAFREPVLLHPAVGVQAPGSVSVARTLHAPAGWGSRALPPGAQWTVRDELLAHAIPALSAPVGSSPVAGCTNYRMDGEGVFDPPKTGLQSFPLGWPNGLETSDHLEGAAQIWRHSDWCRIAYPYVFPAYAFIVKETQLALSTP